MASIYGKSESPASLLGGTRKITSAFGGTGNKGLNFSSPMPTSNYVVVATCCPPSNAGFDTFVSILEQQTTYLNILIIKSSTGASINHNGGFGLSVVIWVGGVVELVQNIYVAGTTVTDRI
jgi:hypothetical protein